MTNTRLTEEKMLAVIKDHEVTMEKNDHSIYGTRIKLTIPPLPKAKGFHAVVGVSCYDKSDIDRNSTSHMPYHTETLSLYSKEKKPNIWIQKTGSHLVKISINYYRHPPHNQTNKISKKEFSEQFEIEELAERIARPPSTSGKSR